MDYGSLINQQAQRIQQAQGTYDKYYGQSNQAKSDLDSFRKNQKSATDFYDAAEQRYGVQGARDTADQSRQALNLTQSLMNNLPNAVTGRTQGSLVSEAQRQRLLAQEMQPLTNQFNVQSGHYNDMQGALQDLLQQAAQRAGLEYQSQQDQYGQLSDLWKTLLGQSNESYGRILSNEQLRGDYVGRQEEARQFQEQMAWERERFERELAEQARQRAAENALQVSLANAMRGNQSSGGGGKSDAQLASEARNRKSDQYYQSSARGTGGTSRENMYSAWSNSNPLQQILSIPGMLFSGL